MTAFDFGRDRRLIKSVEFDRVFRDSSVRLTRPPLRLIGSPNGFSRARLGIVVGKRALRRAVDRNRAKRVIRESFRTTRERLPHLDIVVQVLAAPPGRKGRSANRRDSRSRAVDRPATGRVDVAALRGALERLWGDLERREGVT